MVLVRPGGDQRVQKDCARAEMEQGPHGTGPTRRRLMCEKDSARAKWSRSSPSLIVLESENGNKGTLSEE